MVHSLYWLRESTCQHLIQKTTKPIEKGRHLVDIKIKETKVYSFLQCSQPLIWVVLSLAWVQWNSLSLLPWWEGDAGGGDVRTEGEGQPEEGAC